MLGDEVVAGQVGEPRGRLGLERRGARAQESDDPFSLIGVQQCRDINVFPRGNVAHGLRFVCQASRAHDILLHCAVHLDHDGESARSWGIPRRNRMTYFFKSEAVAVDAFVENGELNTRAHISLESVEKNRRVSFREVRHNSKPFV